MASGDRHLQCLHPPRGTEPRFIAVKTLTQLDCQRHQRSSCRPPCEFLLLRPPVFLALSLQLSQPLSSVPSPSLPLIDLLARAGALSLHFTHVAPAAFCLRLPLRVSQLARHRRAPKPGKSRLHATTTRTPSRLGLRLLTHPQPSIALRVLFV